MIVEHHAVRLLPALVVAAVSAAGAGCGQSQAATSRAAPSETTAAPTPGKARVETDIYAVEARSAGPAKAGQESAIEVTLTTKGDYHINKQYPYKFKANDVDGVSFPKPMLQRADGTFDEKSGKFRLAFVAAKPGHATVGGTISLSVCSDANCIMDKQAVDVDVDVK